MASVYSHGAFFICIAITIACALAADDRIAKADCFATSIRSICDATSSPDSCNHLLDPTNVSQPQIILKNLITSTMDQISKVAPDFAVSGEIESLINSSMPNNGLALSALGICRELLSLAMDNLNKSLSSPLITDEDRSDVTSWVCAGGADLQTCVDEFGEQPQGVRNIVFEKLENPISLTRNSSRIMAIIDRCTTRTKVHSSKSDLLVGDSRDHYPHWLSSKDRRFLRASNIVPNVVVAKDGSGNYTRISDAVKLAPRYSKHRFVIYVKKGLYRERVKVDLEQWNVMMYGDGMNQTIIHNKFCHAGGLGTWDTATFTALGTGFIARDLRFMNTAGAIGGQALALLSTADQSVYYRCRIDSYQDTLYAHSNRQFFRECHIYGTIDFICGGASIVIQKSSIFARKPLPGQANAITAQNKYDPHCPTGIVIQSSNILPSGNLTGVSTFLGRPWTPYATTLFVENTMNGFIDPKGWMPWNNSTPPDTIFLAEYQNRGEGARTDNRVQWKGVRYNLSYGDVSYFTARSFIQADQWLPATQVTYDPGFLSRNLSSFKDVSVLGPH